MPDIQLDYDPAKKRATYTFKNGRVLTVGNVTEEKAQEFLQRSAPEFGKRDCCLTTVDGQFTREGGSHGG